MLTIAAGLDVAHSNGGRSVLFSCKSLRISKLFAFCTARLTLLLMVVGDDDLRMPEMMMKR